MLDFMPYLDRRLGVLLAGSLTAALLVVGCGPGVAGTAAPEVPTTDAVESNQGAPEPTPDFVGRLTDDTGQGLANITVSAYTRVSSPVGEVWTLAGQALSDADGNYGLNLEVGTYRFGFADATNGRRASFYDGASSLETAKDVQIPQDIAGSTQSVLGANPPAKATIEYIFPTATPVSAVDTTSPADLGRLFGVRVANAQPEVQDSGCVATPKDGGILELCGPEFCGGALLQITYDVDCNNPSGVKLTTGPSPDGVHPKQDVKCAGSPCTGTRRSVGNKTRFTWIVPLAALVNGPLEVRWDCAGGGVDLSDPIAIIMVCDPSGYIKTANGIPVFGAPLTLTETQDTCMDSSETPSPAAGSPWADRWSGFDAGPGSNPTQVAQATSAPKGRYAFANGSGHCYSVTVGCAKASLGDAGISPRIFYTASTPIDNLNYKGCANP